jgi:ArsR family transcriptional regulator, arsenate/arsenite/antimonite-responsive transcriptional repressor / arsenate reductase (thioredoxin)
MESTMLPHPLEIFQLAEHPARQTFLFYEPDRLMPPLRVLFLCKQNNARSQMAEALLYHLSDGAIEAFSAGSSPAARIHPLARRAMEAVGINMYEQYPKHVDRYRRKHFDAIVTLCDWTREICPVFPDDPARIHWSFPDPAEAIGSYEEQYAAFQQVGLQLTTRLRLLITVLHRKRQQTT